jgi:hypothetical protein
MICPYNRKSLKQVTQTKHSYEEGNNNFSEQILIEDYVLMECPKEECGAWQNDRCNFNQGHNE